MSFSLGGLASRAAASASFGDRRRVRLHAALYWGALPPGPFVPLAALTPVAQGSPTVGTASPSGAIAAGQVLSARVIPPIAAYPGLPGVPMPWFQTILEATDAGRLLDVEAVDPVGDPRDTVANASVPLQTLTTRLVWRLNPPLPLADLASGLPFAYPGAAVLPNVTAPGSMMWLVVSQMDDTASGASADGFGGGWTQDITDAPRGTVFLGGATLAVPPNYSSTASPLQSPALLAMRFSSAGSTSPGAEWVPACSGNANSGCGAGIALAVDFEIAGRVLNATTVAPNLGAPDTLLLSPVTPAPGSPHAVYRLAGISPSVALLIVRSSGGGAVTGPVVARLQSSAASAPLLIAPLDINFTWLAVGDFAPRTALLALAPMTRAVSTVLAAGGGVAAVTVTLSLRTGNAAVRADAAAVTVFLCTSPATCPGAIVSDYVTLQPGGGTDDRGWGAPAAVAVAGFDSVAVLVVTRADPSGTFAGRSEAMVSIAAPPPPFALAIEPATAFAVWESGAGGARVIAVSLARFPWAAAGDNASAMSYFDAAVSLTVACGLSGSTVSGSSATVRVFVNGSVALPPSFWVPLSATAPPTDAAVAFLPANGIDLSGGAPTSHVAAYSPVSVLVARFSPSGNATRSLRVLVNFSLTLEALALGLTLGGADAIQPWIVLPTAWFNASAHSSPIITNTTGSNTSSTAVTGSATQWMTPSVSSAPEPTLGNVLMSGTWLYWAPGDTAQKAASLLLRSDLWTSAQRARLPAGCTAIVRASIEIVEGGDGGSSMPNASCALNGMLPGFANVDISVCTNGESAASASAAAANAGLPSFCGSSVLKPVLSVDVATQNSSRYYSPLRRAAPYNASVRVRRGGGDLSASSSVPVDYGGSLNPFSGNLSTPVVAHQRVWANFAAGQSVVDVTFPLLAYPLVGISEANFSNSSLFGPLIFVLAACNLTRTGNDSCASPNSSSWADGPGAIDGDACGPWSLSENAGATTASRFVTPVDDTGSVVYEIVAPLDASLTQSTLYLTWDAAAAVAAAASNAVLAVVMRLVNSSWPMTVSNGSLSLSTLQVFPAVDTPAVLLPASQARWVPAVAAANGSLHLEGAVSSALSWPTGDYRGSAVAAWAHLRDPEAHLVPSVDPRGRWLLPNDGGGAQAAPFFRRVWAFSRSDVIIVRSSLGAPQLGDGALARSPGGSYNFGAAGVFPGGLGVFYSVLCRPSARGTAVCPGASTLSPSAVAASTPPLASGADPSAVGFYAPNMSFLWTNLTAAMGGVPLAMLRATLVPRTPVPALWAGVRASLALGGAVDTQWWARATTSNVSAWCDNASAPVPPTTLFESSTSGLVCADGDAVGLGKVASTPSLVSLVGWLLNATLRGSFTGSLVAWPAASNLSQAAAAPTYLVAGGTATIVLGFANGTLNGSFLAGCFNGTAAGWPAVVADESSSSMLSVISWPAASTYDDAAAVATATTSGWTPIDDFGYSPLWGESTGGGFGNTLGTGRGRPVILTTGPDPWASVANSSTAASAGDADVLVVALEAVQLFNSTHLPPTCGASGTPSPSAITPLSRTVVVRVCRTLAACQPWLVRAAPALRFAVHFPTFHSPFSAGCRPPGQRS